MTGGRLPDLVNSTPERLLLGLNAFRLPTDLRDIPQERIDAAWHRAAEAAEPPPGFLFSRRLYHEFGIDPTRHRPSSEALWRRARRGLPFPRVSPAVDATNLLSLEFQVPFGLYDADRIRGVIHAGVGTARDGYEGIRRGWIPLEGKIVLRDDAGPFGNPSADSARTRVGPDTRRLIHVIFFHPQDPRAGDTTHRALHNFVELTGAEPLAPSTPAT